MSDQVPNVERIPFDFYETHEDLTIALLNRWDLRNPACIIEPCSGDGAISDLLKIRFPNTLIVTNDIDPRRKTDHHWDATKWETWLKFQDRYSPIEWVITNPPFNLAHEIVPHSTRATKKGAIHLLRLSWLEPTENRARILKFLGGLMPVNPRPKFRLNKHGKPGTDSVTVAWFIWDHLEWFSGSLKHKPITHWRRKK